MNGSDCLDWLFCSVALTVCTASYFLFDSCNFRIQFGGPDWTVLVGWIRPADRQLIITSLLCFPLLPLEIVAGSCCSFQRPSCKSWFISGPTHHYQVPQKDTLPLQFDKHCHPCTGVGYSNYFRITLAPKNAEKTAIYPVMRGVSDLMPWKEQS